MAVTFELAVDRERLIPLLLLADESEPVVRSYLDEGALFAMREEGTDVGVLLLIREGDAVEVKNLAVAEGRRRRGIGGAALRFAASWAADAGADRLIVGTADTSRDTIGFYERSGFRRTGIREGFFEAYPEPVIEGGVRAHDMVMLEMPLRRRP
jgi:GNAT superfamily N-acetyltransferase